MRFSELCRYLHLLGIFISFCGFCLAITAVSMNKDELTIDEKFKYRQFNSISVIFLFIGFLIFNFCQISKDAKIDYKIL